MNEQNKKVQLQLTYYKKKRYSFVWGLLKNMLTKYFRPELIE